MTITCLSFWMCVNHGHYIITAWLSVSDDKHLPHTSNIIFISEDYYLFFSFLFLLSLLTHRYSSSNTHVLVLKSLKLNKEPCHYWQGILWMNYPTITGLTQRDRQTFILSFTCKASLESPVSL